MFSRDSISVLCGPTNFIPTIFLMTKIIMTLDFGEVKCPVRSKSSEVYFTYPSHKQIQSMSCLLKTNHE